MSQLKPQKNFLLGKDLNKLFKYNTDIRVRNSDLSVGKHLNWTIYIQKIDHLREIS